MRKFGLAFLVSLLVFACNGKPSIPTASTEPAAKAAVNIVGPVEITAKVSRMGPSKWLTKENINIVVGDRTKIKRIRWTKGRVQLIRGYTGDFTKYWNEGDDVTMTITVGGVDVRLSPGRTQSFASDWNLNDEGQSSIIEDISTGDVFTLTIGSEGTPIVKKEYPNPSIVNPISVTYPSSNDRCGNPRPRDGDGNWREDWVHVSLDIPFYDDPFWNSLGGDAPSNNEEAKNPFGDAMGFAVRQWEQYVSVERTQAQIRVTLRHTDGSPAASPDAIFFNLHSYFKHRLDRRWRYCVCVCP